MLRAIRENASLREIGSLPNHEFLLTPDALAGAFKETFPESLANLEKLVRHVHYDDQ